MQSSCNGSPERVQLAVYGMKCIDQHNEAIKILGTSHAVAGQMKNLTSTKLFSVCKLC